MNGDGLQAVIAFIRSSKYSSVYDTIPPWENGTTVEQYLAKVPPLQYESLRNTKLSHYPEAEIRYIASTFSTENLDNLFLLPQLRCARSALIRQCIEESKTPVALFASPMFWQMGPLFYRTCRDAGVPAALVSPRNPPVTRQVIAETGATYVCAPADVARDIYTELEAHKLHDRIKLWHVIVPLGEAIPEALPFGTTIFEQHIFPGVALGKGNDIDGICHIYDDYLVEVIDGKPYITSCTKEAFPLLRYNPTGVTAKKHDEAGRKIVFGHE